jgi:hypothetical protein
VEGRWLITVFYSIILGDDRRNIPILEGVSMIPVEYYYILKREFLGKGRISYTVYICIFMGRFLEYYSKII